MIKLFRNIRQRLLSENRFTRYLIYAIGEIILVVIGILIALQINAWNEQRKNKRLEAEILENLHSEFKNNLQNIEASILQYDRTERSIRNLMSKMKTDPKELQTENLDSLLAAAIDVFEYHPTQNTLAELLSTGNLNLITNDTLKYELLQWTAEFNEIDEAWQTLDDFNQNMVIPYLTKNVSMRNIDKYSLMQWEEKSKFKVDYSQIFNDMEFENHLDNLGWAVVNYKMVLNRLKNLIHRLIRLTSV